MSSANSFEPIKKLLKTPISAIPHQLEESGKSILTFKLNDSVDTVLTKLGQRRVLSAPVLDESGQPLNIIDYLDIIRKWAVTVSVEDRKAFFTKKIGQVFSFSSNPAMPLRDTNPISLAAELFGSIGRLHRCTIIKGNPPKMVGMCCQSDIVRFIATHLFDNDSDINYFTNATAAEASWGSRPVESVKEDISMRGALDKLASLHVSALAVVNSSGTLVGNLSASDFRGLGNNILQDVQQTVKEFLTLRSPASLQPKTVSKSESIGIIVSRLANEKLHHLFFVDSTRKPTGIVTLTDVMNILLTFTPTRPERALSVPGRIRISIHEIRDCTSLNTTVEPCLDLGIEVILPRGHSLSAGSNLPAWNDLIEFEITGHELSPRVVFLIQDKTAPIVEDIFVARGYLAIDWILSGFGKGSSCTSVDQVCVELQSTKGSNGFLIMGISYQPL